MVPFVKFEKRGKNPWRGFTFSKVEGSRFCKFYKWYQIAQNITIVSLFVRKVVCKKSSTTN